jgi:hypothetical protein
MDIQKDAERLLEEVIDLASLSEVEAQLVQDIIVDSASIAARAAAGEAGLDGEIAMIKASALNIAEAKRAKVQRAIEGFVIELIGKIVRAALVA